MPTDTLSTSAPYQIKRDPYSSHSVILSKLASAKRGRLLDVGAAQGEMAELFVSLGYEVTALEGDPHLAELARQRCPNVMVADLDRAIPELQGPFDVAVFADVLEHVREPLAVLRHIAKEVSFDGIIIISVPNVAHLWMRLRLLFGHFEYMDRGILDRTHLKFFTLFSFQEFLRNADLDVLELIATPVPLPLVIPERYHGPLLNGLHALSARLANTWKTMLAYQFIAVTRRLP